MSFPRLYAAASLKPTNFMSKFCILLGFPRLYAAASLKQLSELMHVAHVMMFSAALCRGLIEAYRTALDLSCRTTRFPRLYAAASLKRPPVDATYRGARGFSAALCRGLIEATIRTPGIRLPPSFSAALCRGLIEATGGLVPMQVRLDVFRGSMPRPH